MTPHRLLPTRPHPHPGRAAPWIPGLPAVLAATLAAGALLFAGCVVDQKRCFDNKDCPESYYCNAEGSCQLEEQLPDSTEPIRCPLPAMVAVANAYCMDIYEASRPDATASSPGTDSSRATSREGVLPWQVPNNAAAAAACAAAGKRLCTPSEWFVGCQGPDSTVYAYGDSYDETTCNGIDAFGDKSRYLFKLMPTGSFPDCTNEWGVYDINGNLWEHVAGGSTKTVRGGAYNCGDSATLHRCDYIPGWTPSALGFRCCADGVPAGQDAGPVPDLPRPDLPPADLAPAEAATADATAPEAAPPDLPRPADQRAEAAPHDGGGEQP